MDQQLARKTCNMHFSSQEAHGKFCLSFLVLSGILAHLLVAGSPCHLHEKLYFMLGFWADENRRTGQRNGSKDLAHGKMRGSENDIGPVSITLFSSNMPRVRTVFAIEAHAL